MGDWDEIRYAELLYTLGLINTVICVGGAVLLLLRADGCRSRRLLGCVFAFWGVIYLTCTVAELLGALDIGSSLARGRGVLELLQLVSGNFYLIVLLLYPLEVVRPGWLTFRRFVAVLLPFLACVAVYYAALAVLGQSPLVLYGWQSFVGHIGSFNVWWRFVMVALILCYFVVLLYLTWRYRGDYEQWCQSNYGSTDYMDIGWLKGYGVGVMCIGLVYFWLIFTWSPTALAVHSLVSSVFFFYSFYKGLFHCNPYSEVFFRNTLDEDTARSEAESLEAAACGCTCEQGEAHFEDRLWAYRDEVKRWLADEKPYLKADFKLSDVAVVLPLNRSYLSRVFNEGFGKSFSLVVRDYRMQEAECLLSSVPELSVGEVAERCGFSSASVFHRSFVKSHGGMTPKAYQRQAEKSGG